MRGCANGGMALYEPDTGSNADPWAEVIQAHQMGARPAGRTVMRNATSRVECGVHERLILEKVEQIRNRDWTVVATELSKERMEAAVEQAKKGSPPPPHGTRVCSSCGEWKKE
jgi:hypothetical protein